MLRKMIYTQRRTSIPFGIKFFLGAFILGGLIALGVGGSHFVWSVRSASWPTVEGVVLTSKLEMHEGNKGATYSARITYDYQVKGRHYDGRRLAFGALASSTGYAQGILDRYPVGGKVRVYYDPRDPGEAVLEPGLHGGTWVCFGVGTVFVLTGVMLWQMFAAASRAGLISSPAGRRPLSPSGQKPPLLMGVIFILMGAFVVIGAGSDAGANWLAVTIGGLFILGGVGLLAKSRAKAPGD